MNKVNKPCDCNRGCDACEDFKVCACHNGSEGRDCEQVIGVVVTKRRGAPRCREVLKLLNLPQNPLQMACPPRHRRLCKKYSFFS